jgi:hypothetical protein
MKRTKKRRLQLATETIKRLENHELRTIAGGRTQVCGSASTAAQTAGCPASVPGADTSQCFISKITV